MGIFDAFKKKKPAPAKPAEAPKPVDPTVQLFQTAIGDPDQNKRTEAISGLTSQYWLQRVVREATYEVDKIQALDLLTDQNAIFEIATGDDNTPKIKSLARQKLDDIHLFRFIDLPAVSGSDKTMAISRISDADMLRKILYDSGKTSDLKKCAYRRLQLVNPEAAKEEEDTYNLLMNIYK